MEAMSFKYKLNNHQKLKVYIKQGASLTSISDEAPFPNEMDLLHSHCTHIVLEQSYPNINIE